MFYLEWRNKLCSYLPEVKDVGLWSPPSAPFEQWEWPFNGLLFWHFWVFIEWNVSSGLGEWLEEFPESTSTIPLDEWPPQDVVTSRSSSSSMSRSCVSIKHQFNLSICIQETNDIDIFHRIFCSMFCYLTCFESSHTHIHVHLIQIDTVIILYVIDRCRPTRKKTI